MTLALGGPRLVDVGLLHEAPDNPRVISEDRLQQLMHSLAEQPGLLEARPLIATEEGEVIAGNMRLRAAAELGWAQVYVWVGAFTAAERRQTMLMDNAQMGDWVPDQLAQIVAEHQGAPGADMALLGLPEPELDELLRLNLNGGLEPAKPSDDAPDPPATPITQTGDVITLGSHRLVCGDATSDDTWRLLDTDGPFDAMWTDPPYGVNYEGGMKAREALAGDTDDEVEALLRVGFACANLALVDGAPVYTAGPPGPRSITFAQVFMDIFQLRQTLVWVKNIMALGHSDYRYRHEPILLGYKAGAGRRGRGGEGWFGGNGEDSVFEVPRPAANVHHPTQKPIDLIVPMLKNSTAPGDTVVDPFAGGGSTLLACEHIGRKARCIEISGAYCDVIIARWQQHTGQEATVERPSA